MMIHAHVRSVRLAGLFLLPLAMACASTDPKVESADVESADVEAAEGLEVAGPVAVDLGGGLVFQVPSNWTQEEPANAMRLAQFQMPGANGAPGATCIVSSWPNGIGGLEPNLDRWAMQVGMESAPEPGTPGRATRAVDGKTVTSVFLEGPLSPAMGQGETIEDGAVMAQFVQLADSPGVLTIKAQGERSTLEAHRAGFEAMLGSGD